MKKVFCIVLLIALMMSLSGCKYTYMVPVDLIRVPKLKDEYVKNEKDLTDSELRVLVQSFVPDGCKILEESRSSDKKNIYCLDVDGDDKKEYVVLVRDSSNMNTGFFVIKNKYGSWSKVFEKLDEGVGIQKVEMVKGFYDGDALLLLGNTIGKKGLNEYHLYNFSSGWDEDSTDLGIWSNLSVTGGGNGTINFICDYEQDSMIIDLLSAKYDGRKFSASDDISGYRLKKSEYKDRLNQENNNESLWYYYIYCEYMTGSYDEAINDIKIYMNREKNNDISRVNIDKFRLLEAMVLAQNGNEESAKDVLDSLMTMFEINDIVYKNDIWLYEIYYAEGLAAKAVNDNDDAHSYFEKALSKSDETIIDSNKGYAHMKKQIIKSRIKGVMGE